MRRLIPGSWGCLVIVALWVPVYAVCDQSGASSSDIDLFNAHGCTVKYPGTDEWFPRVYYTRFFWDVLARSGWRDRGFFDACNINEEKPLPYIFRRLRLEPQLQAWAAFVYSTDNSIPKDERWAQRYNPPVSQDVSSSGMFPKAYGSTSWSESV